MVDELRGILRDDEEQDRAAQLDLIDKLTGERRNEREDDRAERAR